MIILNFKIMNNSKEQESVDTERDAATAAALSYSGFFFFFNEM